MQPRLLLVEGALEVDDLSSTLWIEGNHARWGMDLSCGGTYVLSNTWSGSLFLLGSVSAGLGGSIGAMTTPDGASSPIL